MESILFFEDLRASIWENVVFTSAPFLTCFSIPPNGLSRAGHAARDHVFRQQHCWLLHLVPIRCLDEEIFNIFQIIAGH